MKPVRNSAGLGVAVVAGLLLTSCSEVGTPVAPSAIVPAATKMIRVTVPDGGWRLRVERVVEVGAEVWVLAQLRREPVPAVQVISEIEAAVPVAVPPTKLRVFVAGKTWAWPNNEPYEFVPSLDAALSRAAGGRVLHPAGGK